MHQQHDSPSDDESPRADDALDLPAKVRLLTGGNVFTLAAEPAIGLREVALSDGPTGSGATPWSPPSV